MEDFKNLLTLIENRQDELAKFLCESQFPDITIYENINKDCVNVVDIETDYFDEYITYNKTLNKYIYHFDLYFDETLFFCMIIDEMDFENYISGHYTHRFILEKNGFFIKLFVLGENDKHNTYFLHVPAKYLPVIGDGFSINTDRRFGTRGKADKFRLEVLSHNTDCKGYDLEILEYYVRKKAFEQNKDYSVEEFENILLNLHLSEMEDLSTVFSERVVWDNIENRYRIECFLGGYFYHSHFYICNYKEGELNSLPQSLKDKIDKISLEYTKYNEKLAKLKPRPHLTTTQMAILNANNLTEAKERYEYWEDKTDNYKSIHNNKSYQTWKN